MRAPELIGLDVGTTTIKAARIRRKGSRLVVAALAETAIGSDSREGAVPGENISLAIRQCLRQLGGRTGMVVCGLSGAEVTVRTFDFPALPRKQLASAVELEAVQVCPFDVAGSTVAYDVLAGRLPGRWSSKSKPQRTTGVFATAKNDAIQRLRRLCEHAGTRCVLVDVDGLALLNCLEACQVRDEGMAMVLNVGSSYTNLTILSENGQPFVRDIAYAAEGILNHLCHSTGAPRQAVVDTIRGGETSDISIEDLLGPLEQACSILADRVLETVRYHGTRQSSSPLDRMFLCGGLARMTRIMDVLTPLLPSRVEPWNPLTMLPCARRVRKSGVVEQGSVFAVALGLAMRSLRDVQD